MLEKYCNRKQCNGQGRRIRGFEGAYPLSMQVHTLTAKSTPSK